MKKFLIPSIMMLVMASCQDQATVDSYPTKSDSAAAATAEGSSAEAKEERNKQTALASVNAMLAKNLDSAMKDVTADAIDYGDGSGPAIKSKDSVKTMMQAFLAAFPDYKGENLMATADGDYVLVVGEWSGTFKGDFYGAKPTGKSFKVKDVDIFKFNDEGKIIEHRSIYPWASMMQSIGAKFPNQ